MLFKAVLLSILLPEVIGYAISSVPKAGDIIPNQYIVVLRDTISDAEFDTHKSWAESLGSQSATENSNQTKPVTLQTYNLGKLKAYSGVFDSDSIGEIVKRKEVSYVEPDRLVTADALVVQNNVPSWGLGRISHRLPSSQSTYFYDSSAGSGIYAYVIDTGVTPNHVEFIGSNGVSRASSGYNGISNEGPNDENGHGTHVSGTIGGRSCGVAKNVNIIGVKVLASNGSGSISTVIGGIQWAVNDVKAKNRVGKAVANMSLGGSYSAALNSAVNSAYTNGLLVVCAAGNSDDDASNYSPASATSAVTVGATTRTDERASFSNYGPPLVVFAPGVDITSSWYTANNAYATLSGTSMATPHAAGVACYLMAYLKITRLPSVVSEIITLSTKDIVVNPGNSTFNRLLYNGSGR